jgi:hypothetical protein
MLPRYSSMTPLDLPCAEYMAMQEFFRRRADELGFSRTTIDQLADFTPGLASKLLAPTPIKRLGHEHLGPLCAALAVAWIPVEDAQSRAELERRVAKGIIEKRDESAIHAGASIPSRSRRYMREMASNGGNARARKLSPKRRRSIAKKAARIRWRKPPQSADSVNDK